jgi:cytochrome b561
VRLRNTAEDWGAVAKLLHRAGAVLTLAMLGLGLVMVHAGLASAPKFEAYQLHKSTGFLILAVIVARGLWRMAISPPAPPNGMRPWERRLARALHLGLYVLILAMIASGWLMVSGSPLPIPTHLPFGFIMSNLTNPNALIEARAKFTRDIIKARHGGIALHVAGALKHHFVDHDGVLSRMLPFGARIARRRI